MHQCYINFIYYDYIELIKLITKIKLVMGKVRSPWMLNKSQSPMGVSDTVPVVLVTMIYWNWDFDVEGPKDNSNVMSGDTQIKYKLQKWLREDDNLKYYVRMYLREG